MLDQYIPLRLIGQGSYGRALLVRDRSDASSLWVIKQVPIRRIGNGPPVELESQLLSSVHHPHIIQMRESFIDHGLFNIVTEFAEGGDLETLVRARRLLRQERWSESQIWRWLQQLSSALALLHLRGIVHRDIKPSNVFTTADGSVKLGDFGIARVLCRGAKAHTVAGTPLYTSPEICAGTPYDERTDLWSIGCLLYEVMTLAPPFVADRPSDLMRRIARADYAPIDPANYSIKLIALVARLLSVRPESRPSAADLLRECAQSTAGLHAAMLRPGARRAPDRPVLGAAVAVQDKPTSDIAARWARHLLYVLSNIYVSGESVNLQICAVLSPRSRRARATR